VIRYGELQHAGVLVQDVQRAVKFYTEVLGMRDETHLRPNLPYDGIALPLRVLPHAAGCLHCGAHAAQRHGDGRAHACTNAPIRTYDTLQGLL
jgi:catechol 2,3-dioxygenase-like lactoylglutathione lyase family enzyme